MAKKYQDYAIAHENIAEINTMVTQLENTCNLAFTELETEFNNIKNATKKR
jgi:hypothetical protein